jgi:uncharacterized protein DUF5652
MMSDFGDWVVFGHPMNFSLLILVVLWSLFWKGLALWHSARRGEAGWFVAILIINTLGLLEIIYLFAIARVRGGALLRRDG